MNFNSLFFPAPKVHYSVATHYGEMIYIPKHYTMTKRPSDDSMGQDDEQEIPVLNLSSFISHKKKRLQSSIGSPMSATRVGR